MDTQFESGHDGMTERGRGKPNGHALEGPIMTCSVDRKLARGVALPVLAVALMVALMGSEAAVAGEPTAEASAVTAPATPTDARELVSARHDGADPINSTAGTVPTNSGPSAKEAVKADRASARLRRVRREETRDRVDDSPQQRVREASAERPRARYEASAVPWHRSGGGVGLILGVGF
jgi:hypothetical protein